MVTMTYLAKSISKIQGDTVLQWNFLNVIFQSALQNKFHSRPLNSGGGRYLKTWANKSKTIGTGSVYDLCTNIAVTELGVYFDTVSCLCLCNLSTKKLICTSWKIIKTALQTYYRLTQFKRAFSWTI